MKKWATSRMGASGEEVRRSSLWVFISISHFFIPLQNLSPEALPSLNLPCNLVEKDLHGSG